MRNLFRTLVLLGVLWPGEAAMLQVASGPFGSGKAYVDCFFDGRKENCFLDTGSAMTLVRSGFSSAPALGTFHFKTASGRATQAEIIQMNSIKLDGRSFRDVRVGHLQKSSAAQESSVGMDLLGHQPFGLEFRVSRALRLRPKAPPEPLQTLRMTKQGLLIVSLQFGGSPSGALVDTGASVTTVDSAFIRAHPEGFHSKGRLIKGLDGAGHPIDVQLYRAKKVTIGPRTFRNIQVMATDLSMLREEGYPDIYAVLGFNVLRKTDWYFDPQRKVWSVRRS